MYNSRSRWAVSLHSNTSSGSLAYDDGGRLAAICWSAGIRSSPPENEAWVVLLSLMMLLIDGDAFFGVAVQSCF